MRRTPTQKWRRAVDLIESFGIAVREFGWSGVYNDDEPSSQINRYGIYPKSAFIAWSEYLGHSPPIDDRIESLLHEAAHLIVATGRTPKARVRSIIACPPLERRVFATEWALGEMFGHRGVLSQIASAFRVTRDDVINQAEHVFAAAFVVRFTRRPKTVELSTIATRRHVLCFLSSEQQYERLHLATRAWERFYGE